MSDSVVKPGAIVRCVDHIAIRASDTKYLFSLLSESFQLPIVLPMARYGITSSGVVFTGNVNIEVLQFNATKEEKKAKPGSAKFYAIAFEPVSLAESLRELNQRNIPYSPPIPYWGKRYNGYRGKLWTYIIDWRAYRCKLCQSYKPTNCEKKSVA